MFASSESALNNDWHDGTQNLFKELRSFFFIFTHNMPDVEANASIKLCFWTPVPRSPG